MAKKLSMAKAGMAKKPGMEKIERVPTGIPGLDGMLSGGIPTGNIVLLSGACGTGKSILAMQFLYDGAKQWGEPGVYVTLEEDPKKLVANMSMFGWDLEGLIRDKKLVVIKPEIYRFDTIKQIIRDAIDKIGAKRLVVDSYSVLLTYFNDPYEIRNGLVQLDREIKKMGCTALVISDISDNSQTFSTTGVEEFIVDGVIVLHLRPKDASSHEYERAISVRKMRATLHQLVSCPFKIAYGGIIMSGGPSSCLHGGHRTAARSRIRAAKKHGKPAPRKARAVSIQSLKATKPGHTWRWKHL